VPPRPWVDVGWGLWCGRGGQAKPHEGEMEPEAERHGGGGARRKNAGSHDRGSILLLTPFKLVLLTFSQSLTIRL
jgi:hypothetical protein